MNILLFFSKFVLKLFSNVFLMFLEITQGTFDSNSFKIHNNHNNNLKKRDQQGNRGPFFGRTKFQQWEASSISAVDLGNRGNVATKFKKWGGGDLPCKMDDNGHRHSLQFPALKLNPAS